jgi:hypothetical protein
LLEEHLDALDDAAARLERLRDEGGVAVRVRVMVRVWVRVRVRVRVGVTVRVRVPGCEGEPILLDVALEAAVVIACIGVVASPTTILC